MPSDAFDGGDSEKVAEARRVRQLMTDKRDALRNSAFAITAVPGQRAQHDHTPLALASLEQMAALSLDDLRALPPVAPAPDSRQNQQSQDLSFADIYPDHEEEEFSGLADSVEIPPANTRSTAFSNTPARLAASPSQFATGNNPLARRHRR
jgi:hypothetical protein